MAINTFTASGNIGKDCQVRQTKNGKSIATFNLPVKQGYGEHEKTSWITCKMFGKRAEGSLPQYLKKGTKVIVTGEFVLEEWQGQNGEQNKMPVIIVNQLDFGGGGGQSSGGGYSQQQPLPTNNMPTNNKPMPEFDGFEDDEIPF